MTERNDPIERIVWMDAAKLDANDYNPNVVLSQEMRLLEFSILRQGWVQPVLVSRDGVIIDGFHRAMLSRTSKALKERYGGKCPCVVMDIDRPEAMMLTIRINRAKGSHVAFRMSGIVRELVNTHGLDPQEVAQEIGATSAEVDLLLQEGVFEARDIKGYKYSKAWYPVEEASAKHHEG